MGAESLETFSNKINTSIELVLFHKYVYILWSNAFSLFFLPGLGVRAEPGILTVASNRFGLWTKYTCQLYIVCLGCVRPVTVEGPLNLNSQQTSDDLRFSGVGKWSKWSFMVILIPYGHRLRHIHHTGRLGGLNQYQSHQSLQYFTMVLNDHDRNIICDHIGQIPALRFSLLITAPGREHKYLCDTSVPQVISYAPQCQPCLIRCFVLWFNGPNCLVQFKSM